MALALVNAIIMNGGAQQGNTILLGIIIICNNIKMCNVHFAFSTLIRITVYNTAALCNVL